MRFAVMSRMLNEPTQLNWVRSRAVASERVLSFSDDPNCEWAISYRSNKRGDFIRTASFVRKGYCDPFIGED